MPVPITPPEIDLRVVRSRVDDPELLADELGSSAWLSNAGVIKSDDRSSVLSGDVAGRGVIVKTLVTGALRSRAPAALGRTRLARQWTGAELLIEHGLPTVEPVLMWAGRSSKGHHAETLVLERVEGATLLRTLAASSLPVREQHRLAEEAGRLTARLERAGLLNRDHKPSNIIVRRPDSRSDANGHTRLVLIDTAGVTRRSGHTAERMLFNLLVEFIGAATQPRRALLVRALRAYAEETDYVPPRSNRIEHHRALAEITRRIERMLERHGDPTPKDDPLKY